MSDLKPGQKFTTPTPGFGDRVFYETLLRQRPDSFMAQEWCVSYGVLPNEEAAKLNRQVTDRKRNQRLTGGVVMPSSSPTKKKVKKERSGIKPEKVASQKVRI